MFGAPFPDKIGDEFFHTPLTSYGTQKAIGELLLADYSRRGFLDGIGIRLPTIVVRPGQAEQGGLGLLLGHPARAARRPGGGPAGRRRRPPLVREPARRGAVSSSMPRASTRRRLGARRNLTMPGLSVTVGEKIEALGRVAGEKAASLIRREPDPVIVKIVAGWPRNFDPQRALALGFKAEPDIETIIRAHIEDELGGKIG